MQQNIINNSRQTSNSFYYNTFELNLYQTQKYILTTTIDTLFLRLLVAELVVDYYCRVLLLQEFEVFPQLYLLLLI